MASLRRALVSTLPRILTSNRIASHHHHRPGLGSFSRLYSSNESNQSVEIDLPNVESRWRLFNRLLYRSKQRGFLELDLVLGKWVEDHIHSMDESGIKSLVHVLDLVFVALQERAVSNLNNRSATETRAPLGQAWVRGWDDFKKGRDSLITGNQ